MSENIRLDYLYTTFHVIVHKLKEDSTEFEVIDEAYFETFNHAQAWLKSENYTTYQIIKVDKYEKRTPVETSVGII